MISTVVAAACAAAAGATGAAWAADGRAEATPTVRAAESATVAARRANESMWVSSFRCEDSALLRLGARGDGRCAFAALAAAGLPQRPRRVSECARARLSTRPAGPDRPPSPPH